MNLRIKNFLCLLLFTTGSINSTVVRLDNNLIKNSSDQALYERLLNAKKRGYTIQGSSPEATVKINAVAEQITDNNPKANSLTLIQALKGSSLDAPMASGGQGNADHTLREENEKLKKLLEQMQKGGTSTASGQGGAGNGTDNNNQALLDQIEALKRQLQERGAPPSPTPNTQALSGTQEELLLKIADLERQLAAAGGTPPPPEEKKEEQEAKKEDEKKEEKEEEKKEVVVAFKLACTEPVASSEPEKKASDEALVKTLRAIALESIVGSPAQSTQYINSIKTQLAALASTPAFKNCPALLTAVGADGKGNIFTFITDNIKIEEGLTPLYKKLTTGTTLLDGFSGTLKHLFFDSELFNANKRYINTILINIIVASRPSASNLKPTPNAQAESDGLAEDIFQELINLVKGILPQDAPKDDSSPAVAESEQAEGSLKERMQQAKAILTKKSSNAAPEPIKQVELKSVLGGVDYVDWLFDKINILRANPDFLRYEQLLGLTARETSQNGKSEIEKSNLYPLLEALLNVNPKTLANNPSKFFDLKKIINACKLQLVFSNTELENLLSSPAAAPVLKAIGQEHAYYLNKSSKEQAEKIDRSVYVQERVAKVSKMADLQQLVTDWQNEIGAEDANITLLSNALKSAEPDQEVIIKALQDLSGGTPEKPAFDSTKISDILTKFNEKNQQKNPLVDILKEANNRYKEYIKNKRISEKEGRVIEKLSLDDFFATELLKVRIAIHEEKQRKKQKALTQPESEEQKKKAKEEKDDIIKKIDKVFTGYDRRAVDIRTLFKEGNIISEEEINNLFTLKQWYQSTNAYGLLMKIIAATTAESQETKPPLHGTLLTMFAVLNGATSQKNATYLLIPGLTTAEPSSFANLDEVKFKIYDNTLTPMLAALKNYNIPQFIQELISFLRTANPNFTIDPVKAGIGAKKLNTAVTQLIAVMVPQIGTDIAKKINALNTNNMTLDDLPISSDYKLRNIRVYKLIANRFTPLLEMLTKNIQEPLTLDAIRNLPIEEFTKKANEIIDTIKSDLMSATEDQIKYNVSKTREVEAIVMALTKFLIEGCAQQLRYLQDSAFLQWDEKKKEFVMKQTASTNNASSGDMPPPPPQAPPPPPSAGVTLKQTVFGDRDTTQ